MNTTIMCRPASAGVAAARVAHAVATILTGETVLPDTSLPGRYARHDRVLVAAVPTSGTISHGLLERLCDEREADLVCARFDSAGVAPPVFTVGVRLSWKMLYHADFQLWLPRGDGAARLIPLDPVSPLHFEVGDGRIEAWADGPLDARQRRRGCDAANARLRQLVGAL
ncbi:hypothetical protein [Sphingomonas solaris]|uniref:Uncharacterized protein n=1 Tax=Alterirhizorhabdus solaris TaxID=2529389 RepID=A0A558R5T9_9SPHN|nr:hypothetical protein [Sphingomonas solaris]TVV74750.1 hypothetical protein FOY91_08850 [Sphingomonas solaris]